MLFRSLLRIDAGGQEGGGHFANRAMQFERVLPDGDRVHVDHAVDAGVRLLQRHELHDGAEVVAEVQIAGRLHAGEHQFLERFGRVHVEKPL